MNIFELQKKLNDFDLWEIIKQSILSFKEEIIKLNQNQLWDGKTFTGADVRPYYSEDPYFKTEKQAIGYRNYKQKITPNSRRNPDAPNLFINGYFHSLIDVIDRGNYIEIGAQGFENYFGDDLDEKFKNIYGLTDENWELIKKKILPDVIRRIENYFKL